MPQTAFQGFADMATAIRVLAMDAVEAAGCGHPGMPMGMADVATVLFARHLKFDPADPAWPDRDRFVLSNGHGSMLQYALLALTGYPGMTLTGLKDFRQWGSVIPGHPEYGHTPGVETTTGPLGQGLATAVGLAMAERRLNARFGDELVDHRTWVVCGDGDLMEGVSQEAISLAGRLKLARLAVLWDDNDITIDGALALSESGDQLARFRAAGWATRRIDGHDLAQIDRALRWAKRQARPVLIACKTKIGKGSATLEGHHDTHGKALGAKEVAATREKLGWTHAPFVVPDATLAAWRATGRRGATAHASWRERLKGLPGGGFHQAISGELAPDAFAALDAHIARAVEARPAMATRAASGEALAALVPAIPALMGGSADLTGSNNTFVKGMSVFDAPAYAGDYVNYGIREHAMAAAMNGMALHGGVIPYGGTFLVFTDYSRPAIRLAALMGVRAIHVGTHDSIGVGEDGPTHQPVEHLAALRAIPGLDVWRPADVVETAEAWRAVLQAGDRPAVMALSRQKTAAVRIAPAAENLSARGAYTLRAAEGGAAKVVIFATGTEVPLALKARETLQAEGAPTRVVSAPCWSRFAAQDEAYRREVLGEEPVRAAVEAAVRFGWDAWIGPDGVFVGMRGFGASAPAERLYAEFAITADALVAAIRARL
jgi:transketolase